MHTVHRFCSEDVLVAADLLYLRSASEALARGGCSNMFQPIQDWSSTMQMFFGYIIETWNTMQWTKAAGGRGGYETYM